MDVKKIKENKYKNLNLMGNDKKLSFNEKLDTSEELCYEEDETDCISEGDMIYDESVISVEKLF